ncbi:glycosyltransferase family 4 protein [Desulfosoma caldarium]|uniref:Glycosyltransferase involved in cell wall biosynthesis n=1 Tax=Desulfosoma caldarium TaxID=610254 RepID=A0A3N1USF7_9BACT|nr:glycosyltransferase family 4 protein [Desulfosoma caldarium]ROQ90781.1 glycosyltransferase involved in cell wall biosynthesis [Desulfosoma caldarium]
MSRQPAVWFPTIRCGTGTDVFTVRLAEGLRKLGLRAEISWLPHRAEYAPWTVRIPKPPSWANLVHINSWLHPRFVPKRLPLIVTVHHSIHDPAQRPYKNFPRHVYHRHWIRPIEGANMARAEAVVAVSHFVAGQIRVLFGLRNVMVIHNGIDTDHVFTPYLRRPKPHRPFRLLYVGNWKTHKGVDLLKPIMETLGSDFELRYTADRAGAHVRYRLPANTRCLGRLEPPALAQAYRDADALLFPSRSEGLGLAVIEAMACGLPVIASSLPPVMEIITHERHGLLCQGQDVAAFCQAARRLRKDVELWKALRFAARQTAEKHFSLEKQVAAYCALYDRVLESSPFR